MSNTKFYEILHKWYDLNESRFYKVFQIQEPKRYSLLYFCPNEADKRSSLFYLAFLKVSRWYCN